MDDSDEMYVDIPIDVPDSATRVIVFDLLYWFWRRKAYLAGPSRQSTWKGIRTPSATVLKGVN